MEINAPILMSELFTVADPAPRLSAVRVARTPAGHPVPVCTPAAFVDYVTEWHRVDPNGWHFPWEIEVTSSSVYYGDMAWPLHSDGTFTLSRWAEWQVCPTVHPAPALATSWTQPDTVEPEDIYVMGREDGGSMYE